MNCTDIGTIQAFLDGELSYEYSAELSQHLGECDACALMLADAESESALVFPMLEREFDAVVPTHRLWTKINDSIEHEKQRAPWWKKIGAFGLNIFANPSLSVVMAAILIIVIGGTLWLRTETNTVVPDNNILAGVSDTQKKAVEPISTDTPIIALDDRKADVLPTVVHSRRDVYTANISRRPFVQTAAYRTHSISSPSAATFAGPAADTAIDNSGEESYQKTIASLNRSIRDKKDVVMSPSERVSYERNMALVDDSISKMQDELKRNPQSSAARQVLYTSYQNKIDLLNSVSQREELVASLR